VNPSEETLMAYVDGELDAAARAQVAGAIAADPQIARRVAAHEALRGRLRATFDEVLEEPVPPQLISLVHLRANAPTRGQLLQFPGKRTPQRAWWQWSSLAASFVLGALVWQFASRLYAPGPLSESHGEFVASGALARALSGQLSAQQNPSAWKVQVLAHDEVPQVATGQYRQAASSLPPTVLRAVDELIAGDPLDAAAEAQARAAGWHGGP